MGRKSNEQKKAEQNNLKSSELKSVPAVQQTQSKLITLPATGELKLPNGKTKTIQAGEKLNIPASEKSVYVEKQEVKESAFSAILSKAASHSSEEKSKRGPYVKQADREKVSEFATLISTGLTLIIAAINLPPDIAPNSEEVNAFSVPLTKLLLRHLPISGKLSDDMLDIIGMIGIISGYYMRIAPILKSTSGNPKKEIKKSELKSSPDIKPISSDPVTLASPVAGAFLEEAGNGND
jgi:hypothetical protein